MSKALILLVLLAFVGCNSSNNINPLGEEYFIKFYGGTGDQEGISVQSTTDGGFIIGGNSIAEFGGPSDYLLIKVDAFGNQEWLQTYDFGGTGGNDVFTDILVEDGSYVVAGTSAINGVDKMVLLRIGVDGILMDSEIFLPSANNSFKTNGISPLSSGGFLVTGPVVGGDVNQTGKSLLVVVNPDLSPADTLFYPFSTVDPGEETVFVKGLEVINHFDPPGLETTNYLIVGYVNSVDGPKLSTFQFRESLGSPIINPIEKDYNNSKVIDIQKMSNNSYKLLSASDNETYLINVNESSIGYTLGSDQILRSEKFIKGVSLSLTQFNNFLIASNVTPLNSTITASSIVESTSAGTILWERNFGTEISYTSGKVISLPDGSVVYTGTAGFKGQTKTFLIKVKSNGEMK